MNIKKYYLFQVCFVSFHTDNVRDVWRNGAIDITWHEKFSATHCVEGINTHYLTTLQKNINQPNDEPTKCMLIAKDVRAFGEYYNQKEIELIANKINELGVIIQNQDIEIQQLKHEAEEKEDEISHIHNMCENQLIQHKEVCSYIHEEVNVYKKPLFEVASDLLRSNGLVLKA